MTKPVTIPNTFATATTAIPLSQLDGDFTAVATAINDANTYSNYAADTGSANAYVVTFSGVSTAYSAGLRIQFKAGNANTGASTINVNAQGAKSITYQDGNALASGTIAVNSIVDVMYDGTQFLLMNDPAGATGGDVTGPASATDNAVVRFDGTTGKLVQNSVVTIADSTGDISGVGQLNATTVDTTNIEVTNIKAKDGTAAASIANSTGVVSITANPVLSGGTANGVLYLNGSKVATSGSALTFDGTKLTIGTATAAGTLTVVAPVSTSYGTFDAPTSGFAFHDYKFNGTRYGVTGQGSALYSGGSNTDFGILASNSLVMGASGTQHMRIQSSGSVSMASGLALGSLVDVGSTFSIASTVISAGAGTYPMKWNSTSGAVTYDTSSRLVKDNIQDSPYGLAEVLQLQPRKYFRTDDQKDEIGFIADEVKSILPEFVPMVAKSIFTKDEEDTELIAGGVNYEKLTAVLTKAIQEQQARIESLTARVAQLEGAQP